jgi:hypothetical protein
METGALCRMPLSVLGAEARQGKLARWNGPRKWMWKKEDGSLVIEAY